MNTGVSANAASEADDRDYVVVVNQEEQHSIWFADRELPKGWRAVGSGGKKGECLEYIGRVWTDMRPLTLRKATAESE